MQSAEGGVPWQLASQLAEQLPSQEAMHEARSSEASQLAAQLPLTDGAEKLIRVLKRLGYRTAVISGGFSIAADSLKARLGIDYAHANVLEVEAGPIFRAAVMQ